MYSNSNSKDKFQILLALIFVVMSILIVFPIILLASVSLSNEQDIAMYGYRIFPKSIDLSAYRFVLENPLVILRAYRVTLTFSVITMFLSTLLTAMIAYPLSIKELKYRNGITFYLYFTMLFSGGLVPTYLLITQYLHLNDTIWVYIIPGIISPWYVFMMRTFMKGIPGELRESVKIDGGDEFIVFFKIILPLSKPVLSTIALFVFLGKWNDWYTPMLYINNEKLNSLQYMLQLIMRNLQLLREMRQQGVSIDISQEIPQETVRMATAVLVMGPALFVFPFFQKYFVKGITVGSVKG